MSTKSLAFKGFDDWVELFTVGTHVSADGTQFTVTTDTLNGIAKNFSTEGDTVPAVHGHPKHDSPAFGWLGETKVDGDSLWGKFRDVAPEFAQGVADKRYPNRSIKIRPMDDGSHQLVHVGWLGGVAPAVKGLKPVEFAEGDGVELTFMSDDNVREMTWSISSAFRAIGRLFSSQKTLNLIQHGETGDVLDVWDLETLATTPARLDAQLATASSFNAPIDNPPSPEFSQPTGAPVMELTQEDLDRQLAAARNEGRTAATTEFSAQVTTLTTALATKTQAEDKSFVEGLVKTGRLLPAQANGLAEFMGQLDDQATFEFSVGEGAKAEKKSQSGRTWFKSFMESLPEQLALNRERCQEDGSCATDDSAEKLAADIQEFMDEQSGKGITVSVAAAKRHVLEKRK